MKRLNLTDIAEWSPAKIKKVLTDLNSRFLSAKNEFESVLVLMDMREVMLADESIWIANAKDLQENRPAGWEGPQIEALKQAEQSREQINLIDAELRAQYLKAFDIQQAMLNDYKLQNLVLIPFDEFYDNEL